MNYPLEIEAALVELSEIDEQLRAKRSSIRSLELDVTLDACGAKDENGKLILTNDRQREGAVARMLSEREDYTELGKGLANLERERRILEARLERLRLEVKLEILAAEQRNALANLRVADSLFYARTNGAPYRMEQQEIEMPF
jgi:hypothetical protein